MSFLCGKSAQVHVNKTYQLFDKAHCMEWINQAHCIERINQSHEYLVWHLFHCNSIPSILGYIPNHNCHWHYYSLYMCYYIYWHSFVRRIHVNNLIAKWEDLMTLYVFTSIYLSYIVENKHDNSMIYEKSYTTWLHWTL